MRSDTQTVTITARPKDVLAFVGDGENLPRWAIGFAKSVKRDGDRWIVTTGQGEVPTRIHVDESTGTIDFHIEPAPGVIATRTAASCRTATAASSASRRCSSRGTPDDVFAQLVTAVTHELVALKAMLEVACPI